MTNRTTCDNCGTGPRDSQDGNAFTGGLWWAPRSMGFYGGFTDNCPWEPITAEEDLALCHECSVSLMRAFPVIAQKMLPNRGGHPNLNGEGTDVPPCCEWAWTDSDEGLWFGTPDEGWVRRDDDGNLIENTKVFPQTRGKIEV